MQALGIDIHKSFYQVVHLVDGKKTDLKFQTGKIGEELLLQMIVECGPCRVTMEACTGAFHLHDRIVEHCPEALPCIVDGRKFRQRFPKDGRKTDKVDAHNLARLGTFQEQETIWIPDEAIRRQRRQSAHRHHLVEQQTQERNRIHSALREHGIKLPFQSGTLWTLGGREWLKARLEKFFPELRQEIHFGLVRLELLEEQLGAITREIAKWAAHSAEAQLLLTIPGIGATAAHTILAELGNPKRFSSSRQVTRIAGLDPSISQSGATCSRGAIAKRGRSRLRWIAVECAIVSKKHCPRLKQFYDRIYRRSRCGSKAKVATGRKLLNICWHVLMSGRPYNNEQPKMTETKRVKLMKAAKGLAPKRQQNRAIPSWLANDSGAAEMDSESPGSRLWKARKSPEQGGVATES